MPMHRLLTIGCLLALAAGCKKNPVVPPDPGPDPELRSFNVNAEQGCSNPILRPSRRVATTANVVIYADTLNPAGGFTAAQYQQIADQVETVVWPVSVATFGTPTDIDNNGKIVILYTRAVNELTPPGAGFYVGGFFWSRDLFPKTGSNACAASNVAEMFYMLAPDPAGAVNNNPRSVSFVRGVTVGTIAHELQHLINASRRLYVNIASQYEETWLDEGLSHIAEELVFYQASGLGPRQNIGVQTLTGSDQARNAFNEFGIQNFGRLQDWLSHPHANTPFGTDDDLATRGSAWQFLRYAADRRGGDERQFWHSLVNTKEAGLTNLANVLGTPPLPWFRDWGVAVYTDDAVPGTAGRFQMPSWNFRDIYAHPTQGGRYPLRVDTLVTGVPRTFSLRAGSSRYIRMGVPPAATADVRVSAAGTAVGGACTALSLNVGEVHQVRAQDLPAFCLAGGAGGADYALIPFHESQTAIATTSFTVTGTGVVPPLGPPSPDRSGGTLLIRESTLKPDWEFHHRLRERERAEFAELTGRVRPEILADPAPGAVLLSIVRTR
jgi:hypothetical protein